MLIAHAHTYLNGTIHNALSQKENSMKNSKRNSIAALGLMAALLSLAGGLAFANDKAPLTPELAAKKENVRKQNDQRITPEKKKAATENLKAERLKVYQAKQAVKHAKPEKSDN
jgi:hypothetical protein